MGHAFICYDHADSRAVDRLQAALVEAGVQVWRDTDKLWPGHEWQEMIRRAIADNTTLVFIACFSRRSVSRRKSYVYKELRLAIDQLTQLAPGVPWFIPVRLDECDIPDLVVDSGRTFAAFHHVDLFGRNEVAGTQRLVTMVRAILAGRYDPSPSPDGSGSTDWRYGAGSRPHQMKNLAVRGAMGLTTLALTVPLVVSLHPGSANAAPCASASRTELAGDLALGKHVTLGCSRGADRITANISASNPTGRPLIRVLAMAIPAGLAVELRKDVRLLPAASGFVEANHTVGWVVRVPAGGQVTVGYAVQVAHVPSERQASLLVAEASGFPIRVNGLRALRLVPEGNVAVKDGGISVGLGQKPVTLRLSGVLSNGDPAPGAVLNYAVWSTARSSFTIVGPTGKVGGLGSGTTRLTITIGDFITHFSVRILPAHSAVGGYQPPASGPTNPAPSNPPSSPSSTSSSSSHHSKGSGGSGSGYINLSP